MLRLGANGVEDISKPRRCPALISQSSKCDVVVRSTCIASELVESSNVRPATGWGHQLLPFKKARPSSEDCGDRIGDGQKPPSSLCNCDRKATFSR